MTDQAIGEIRPFAFGFVPRGWAPCDGRLLPIATNTALFSILRTSFGGNGSTTFALPDLRGCVPMSWGPGPGLSERTLGERGGAAEVRLTVHEMPEHSHDFNVSSQPAVERQPDLDRFLAKGAGIRAYGKVEADATMAQGAIGLTGEGTPHTNLMPYQVVSFCIALEGLWPGGLAEEDAEPAIEAQ